ncbi:MAG: T9SS type A sorting domain-containing protein, partial [Chitinophagales bacterium]
LSSAVYGIDPTPITQFLDNGYWDFVGVGTPNIYDLTLTSGGVTNMGALTTQHAIFQNSTTGPSGWADAGTSAVPGVISGGTIDPQAKNVSGFGFFGIGRSDEYVLPIILTEFEGSNIGTANVLTWSTAQEMNNDYFTVERSIDGHNYASVGTVDGAGNSDQITHYTFTDKSPSLGTNYYRLKQTDFNGFSDYSDVISIQVDGSFEIGNPYPNPVVSDVHLNIVSENTALTYLRILDLNGKTIYEEPIQVVDGLQTLTVKMQDLTPGMYIVEMLIDGIRYNKPVIKQ